MRYVLLFVLIASAIIVGCGGGEEKATPSATPAVTATEVMERPTPTLTAVVTETPVATPEAPSPTPTEGPSTAAPTLEENTAKLMAALRLDPDGIYRYEDPQGSFRIVHVPLQEGFEGKEADFMIWILKTPLRENAEAAVDFMHSLGIDDHCHPMLSIVWMAPKGEWGKFKPEDLPLCVEQ